MVLEMYTIKIKFALKLKHVLATAMGTLKIRHGDLLN